MSNRLACLRSFIYHESFDECPDRTILGLNTFTGQPLHHPDIQYDVFCKFQTIFFTKDNFEEVPMPDALCLLYRANLA